MGRLLGSDETTRDIQDALAPFALLSTGLHEDVVGYVLTGAAPEILTAVAAADTADVDRLLDQPGRTTYYSSWVSPDLLKQVAALRKGWTKDSGVAARRRLYATAGVEQVVRLARLLAQACETVEVPGVPEWFSLLVHDTAYLGSPKGRRPASGEKPAKEPAPARWTPPALEAAAVEGGVPADDAVRTVLLGIVHRSPKTRSWYTDPRASIARTPAFDDYLARHVTVLADIAPTLSAAGKDELLDRVGKRVTTEAFARIVADLTVDAAKGVRITALKHLAPLPDTQQVATLAPYLATAPSGRLGEVVTRLAALDGGIAACEEALAALRDKNGKIAAGQGARVKLLEQTVERSRALQTPAEEVAIELPEWEPLPEAVLDDAWLKQVRTDVETATAEARANLAEMKKRTSAGSKDWALQSARNNLERLLKISDKDFEVLPAALSGQRPVTSVGKHKSSPLVQWLTERRRDPFAGQGLMLRIRLQALAHPRNGNNNFLWSLRGHLDELTDLRQLHEALQRVGIEDAETPVIELVLDRWWGQEISTEVTWPWFAERQQLIVSALQGVDGGSDRTGRALEVLRRFPLVPAAVLPSLTALALGAGKTHRVTAQHVLETHAGARSLAEQALADTKSEVRASAAVWLQRIGDPAAVPALRAALKKERREAPRAALLSALESLGDDISTDLAPTILEAEATKGLTGKAPTSLDWFPFDQLPQVRWAATGDVVPSSVVRWWAVLATKLKAPSGEGLIARYVGLLDPASRAQLGSFVLRAWVAQDTRGPSVEESRKHADQFAESRWTSMQAAIKRHPEYYAGQAGQTVEDFWKNLYRESQATYLGSATQEKGLLALTVGMPGAELAKTAQHYFSAHKGRRAQADYLVRALAANGDRAAVQQLLAVARRFKQRTVQETAAALAQDIADRNGWDGDQLADRTVQTAGFDDDGILRLDLGSPAASGSPAGSASSVGSGSPDGDSHRAGSPVDAGSTTGSTDGAADGAGERVVTGRITEAFTLELRNPAGKVVKALPGKRASDDAEVYAEAKRQLKESRAELKAVVTLQTQRFTEAMVTGRTWSFADWNEFVLGHPLMSRLAARLVWAAEIPTVSERAGTDVAGTDTAGTDTAGTAAAGTDTADSDTADALRVTFRPGDGGALIGVDDEDVTVPADARVSLVHAATLGEDADLGAPAWRAHLADYEITPLFDQGLGADTATQTEALPEVSDRATAIETRKGWLSDSYTIRGRATKLGYVRSQAEDAGWFSAYCKEYPTLGITVEIEFTGAFLPEENITAAVERLVFRRTGTWGDTGRLALKDVSRVLLAVSYRDYVTVADGGTFDPDWAKKSEY